MNKPIYLDHAATTPIHPAVLDAMLPFLDQHHGNAGSLHRFGRTARRAIDHAREQVARLIQADPREILFTSGGTEANNQILRSLRRASHPPGSSVLCSAIEHRSVLEQAAALALAESRRPALIPVARSGRVAAEALEAIWVPGLRLVSVMHANNETGTLQPIEELATICHRKGICFHTDAAQSAGKIPVDVRSLPLDALTLSAHKLQGPKGVGACFLRSNCLLEPQLLGGAQERGRRAGTENVAGIIGFGKACELAAENLREFAKHTAALRDQLEQATLQHFPVASVNGKTVPRLPHISNLAFKGLEAETLMMALDAEGIAVSTGSACSSGSLDPSHVLLAMGQTHEAAHSAIRISLGLTNTRREIETFIRTLAAILARLRAEAPL